MSVSISRNYEKLFEYFCHHGDLEKAQDLHHYFGKHIEVDDGHFFIVCQKGYEEFAKWIFEEFLSSSWAHDEDNDEHFHARSYDFSEIMETVCEEGHVNLALWMLEVISDEDEDLVRIAFETAVANGRLALAQAIYEAYGGDNTLDVDDDDHAIFRSAAFDSLDMVQWVYSLHKTDCEEEVFHEAFANACHHSNLEVLQWIYWVCPTVDVCFRNLWGLHGACSNGKLEILVWLFETFGSTIRQSPDLAESLVKGFRMASILHHYNTLMWLLQHCPEVNNIECYSFAFVNAVSKPDWDVLNYLVRICPALLDSEQDHCYNALEDACKFGEKKAILWLKPFLNNNRVSLRAGNIIHNLVIFNKLSMAPFLLELFQSFFCLNGDVQQRSLSDAAIAVASADSNDVHFMQWLYANNPSFDIAFNKCQVFRHVCKKDQLEIAQWMLVQYPQIVEFFEHSVFLEEFLFDMFPYSSLPMFKWLYTVFPNALRTAKTHRIFIQCCKYSVPNFKKMLVLVAMEPERYKVVIDEVNKKVLKWEILKTLPISETKYSIETSKHCTMSKKRQLEGEQEEEESNYTCLVCYDETSMNCMLRTNCGHMVCQPCSMKWYNPENSFDKKHAVTPCPYCRTGVESFEMVEFV